MAKSKIQWTDAVWNPVTGCDKVSQGCKNCYAGRLAKGRLSHLPEYKDGFFGNVQLHTKRLQQPLHWKKPRMVFVNSMSDLFHPDVPFEFIDQVFAIMADAKQHVFQVLTKRPERMAEYFYGEDLRRKTIAEWWKGNHIKQIKGNGYFYLQTWPLPNVWLGTSVEDQKTADERIPHLIKTPAVVRFLSIEPLLGPIDIQNAYSYRSFGKRCSSCSGTGNYNDNFKTPCPDCDASGINPDPIDWIICGGESGPKARPMHPDWVRTIRDQCKEASVPFFFKQWGEWMPEKELKHLIETHKHPRHFIPRPVQVIDGVMMHKIGKKHAGNLLDGKKYEQFPTRPTAQSGQTGITQSQQK